MVKHLLKGVLPLAAIALGLTAASCGNLNVTVGDGDGVPLSELDMGGTAPTKLVLAGPDRVVVTEGAELAITVSGDQNAIDALRFNLEKGTLGIMREKSWKGPGIATVAVTMPAAREIVLAGSGDISAPAMVEDAEVNIAGSGTVAIAAFFSLVVARMLTPLMGAYLMTSRGTQDDEAFWIPAYLRLLGWTLRWRWLTVLAGIAFFAGSMSLTLLMPADFMPATDRARSVLASLDFNRQRIA